MSESTIKLCKHPGCQDAVVNSGYCRPHYNDYCAERRNARKASKQEEEPEVKSDQKLVIKYIKSAILSAIDPEFETETWNENFRIIEAARYWAKVIDKLQEATSEIARDAERQLLQTLTERVHGKKDATTPPTE